LRRLTSSNVISSAISECLYSSALLVYLPTFESVSLPSKPTRLEFIVPVAKNAFLKRLGKHIEDFCWPPPTHRFVYDASTWQLFARRDARRG
jgi:hypothetical protein